MFGFKKAITAQQIVLNLGSFYTDIIEVVEWVEKSPFDDIHEAGIYVASIATTKILSLKNNSSFLLADEFNLLWLEYLHQNPHQKNCPTIDQLTKELQERYPVYRDMFFTVIDPSNKEKASDKAVQLMWELFSNCTKKKHPEKFIKLMSASSILIEISLEIYEKIKD